MSDSRKLSPLKSSDLVVLEVTLVLLIVALLKEIRDKGLRHIHIIQVGAEHLSANN